MVAGPRCSQPVRKLGLLIAVNVLLLELVAFALIHLLAYVRPDLRLDLTVASHFETITVDDLEQFWSRRDAVLGWDRVPFERREDVNSAGDRYVRSFGADGARMDAENHGRTMIATYGDSFTEGAEVGNDQTWQAHLEELLGYDVKNYGVSGYGIGQSYLKLKGHLENGRIAPITMLVVYVDDLGRAMNNFRWFLNRNTGGKLAYKPSFRYLGNEVRFFPVPNIRESMSLDDLEELTVDLARNDYWMSRWVYFVPEFPVIFQLAGQARKIASKLLAWMSGAGPDISVWQTVEGRLVAAHVFNAFRRDVAAHGSTPVILFLPAVNEWTDGRRVPAYKSMADELASDRSDDLLAIDLYDSEFDASSFSILPFTGHPSPAGNRIIASHVARELRMSALFPGQQPSRIEQRTGPAAFAGRQSAQAVDD